MYHWTAAFEASVSIAEAVPSALSSSPPWAYRNASPRSRPGLRQIGALRSPVPLRPSAAVTSSSIVVGAAVTRSLL